jgi:hypothetical protein
MSFSLLRTMLLDREIQHLEIMGMVRARFRRAAI